MKNILRSMKLWQKFAVLGVIASVMTAVPLYELMQYKNSNIAVAKAENQGLDTVEVLIPLQRGLQAHRGLSAMALAGNAAADGDRQARQAEVNAQFSALAKIIADNAYGKPGDELKAMKAEWDRLSQQVDGRSISAADSLSAHTALVARSITLIETVADVSGLSLDPVAETYYLMTAFVDHLPRLTEALARAGGQGAAVLAAKEASATGRAQFAQLVDQAAYLRDRAGAQIEKAQALSPELKGSVVSMQASASAAKAFFELTQREVVTPARFTLASADYFKAGTLAVDAQYKLLGEAVDGMQHLMHARIHENEQARSVMLAVLGALSLLALSLGYAIMRSVTRPVSHAVDAANAVAAGDLSFAIDDRGSDEAGQLLRRMVDMQGSLQQRKLEDAQRLAETEAQRAAATEVAEEIGSAVDGATQGDFSRRIPTVGKEQFHAELCVKFNQLIDTVSGTIREVRAAADQLGAASSQVSQTSQSLSHSASQQAASVEETTASLQQMSASVKQNAESATVTDGMAAQAARQAQEGGAAVSQTSEAMASIAGKISVIDDIAHQTNLLALNAAIEAARAGEHGKGFAVVAAEVRKLAERSQVAAQEIGMLAGNSVKLAEKAGALLTQMVPAIHKTSELVQEIAAASGEQNDGVAQITGAMNHLSATTQQTASASEELSATAEELAAQAAQLQELMAFFRLAEDEGGKPAARPRASTAQAQAPALTNAELRFGQGGGKSAGRPAQRPSASSTAGLDEAHFARF